MWKFVPFLLSYAVCKIGRRAKRPRRRRPPPRFVPQIHDLLEDRILMATWVPIGPAPQIGSFSTALIGQMGSTGQTYSGRISAEAVSPNYDGKGDAAMFIGAAGGGIWRSTNFSSAQPTWTALTDSAGLAGNQPISLQSGLGAGGHGHRLSLIRLTLTNTKAILL